MRRLLRTILKDYGWVHTSLGIVGNVFFVVGSVLFLSGQHKTASAWCFIAGSSGMLIGSLGNALVGLVNQHNHGK